MLLNRGWYESGDARHGDWSRDELETMDACFVAAVEAAFASGLERRESARLTATFRKQRVTEETILDAAWSWFCRRNRDMDVAFSEIVARCPGVEVTHIRADFDRRFGRRSTTSSA
jgi:hypothetical protein